MKIMTNSDVQMPIDCTYAYGMFMHVTFILGSGFIQVVDLEHFMNSDLSPDILGPTMNPQHSLLGVIAFKEAEVLNAVQETLRTYFPETWIWDLVHVG